MTNSLTLQMLALLIITLLLSIDTKSALTTTTNNQHITHHNHQTISINPKQFYYKLRYNQKKLNTDTINISVTGQCQTIQPSISLHELQNITPLVIPTSHRPQTSSPHAPTLSTDKPSHELQTLITTISTNPQATLITPTSYGSQIIKLNNHQSITVQYTLHLQIINLLIKLQNSQINLNTATSPEPKISTQYHDTILFLHYMSIHYNFESKTFISWHIQTYKIILINYKKSTTDATTKNMSTSTHLLGIFSTIIVTTPLVKIRHVKYKNYIDNLPFVAMACLAPLADYQWLHQLPIEAYIYDIQMTILLSTLKQLTRTLLLILKYTRISYKLSDILSKTLLILEHL